jgi:hypothetical protein
MLPSELKAAAVTSALCTKAKVLWGSSACVEDEQIETNIRPIEAGTVNPVAAAHSIFRRLGRQNRSPASVMATA